MWFCKRKNGRRFNVNKRIVYSTRAIGHTDLQNLYQNMKMLGIVSAPDHKIIIEKIKDATKLVVEETMDTAANDIIKK